MRVIAVGGGFLDFSGSQPIRILLYRENSLLGSVVVIPLVAIPVVSYWRINIVGIYDLVNSNSS
jgi:hypothetical protein